MRYRPGSPGFIYFLRNAEMRGLYKIGRTSRCPHRRAREISDATGVPVPFEAIFVLACDHHEHAEEGLHRRYGYGRINPAREFFRFTDRELCNALMEAALLGSFVFASDWLRTLLASRYAGTTHHAFFWNEVCNSWPDGEEEGPYGSAVAVAQIAQDKWAAEHCAHRHAGP